MTETNEPLFAMLDPPPDGLAGLRARLDTERRGRMRRPRWRLAVLMAGLVGLVAIMVMLPPEPELPPELDLVRMHLGQLPPPTEAVTLVRESRTELALQRVPLDTDQVVFYLVGSMTDPTFD